MVFHVMQKTFLKDIVFVFMLSLFFLICTTQHYPLLEPDEARYSEIPREMVETGEYIVPRLNGVIYIEKPVLFYWLQSLSLHVFGFSEGSFRFANAFIASLMCVMVYWAGHVLYDRRTGLWAAALLFSSMLFFGLSHFITLDMTLSTFMTGCLFFLLAGLVRQENDGKQRACLYASAACAALAVMTKGLVGLLLPGSIFLLWMLLTRDFGSFKRLHLIPCLCLFFLIVLPWHVIIQYRVPEFFDFYIVGQQFLRYLTMAEKRYQPVWFFIPILFAGLIPWVVFAMKALWRSGKELKFNFSDKRKETFLWVWIVFIFMFFSLSKSKLVPYILPVMPPIILLLAHDLRTYARSRWEWVATLTLVLLIATGLCLYPMLGLDRSELYMPAFLLLSALLVLTFSGCIVFLWRKKPIFAFGVLLLGSVSVFSLAIPLWSEVADRSIKPLAMVVRQMHGQYDEVVAFRKYYQDLPLYTQQIVTVVDKEGELDFGIKLEDKSAYMIKQDVFWTRWKDPNHRILMVISRNKYQEVFGKDEHPPKILAETSDQLLVENH